MKNKHIKRTLALLLMLSMLVGMLPTIAVAAPAADAAEIYDLRVNDLVAPVGIDDPTPSFSWKMNSDAIGAAQTAYAITVTDGESEVWNTGWVESSRSVSIEYGGEPLCASTEYLVTVKVKDQDGQETEALQSTFEMGLLGEDPFGDASFISYDDAYAPISDLTAYNIEFDATMLEPIGEIPYWGFCFGVKDAGNLTMWQLYSNNNIMLRPHTKTNNSWGVKNFDITETMATINVTPANLLGQKLHVKISVNGTTFTTYFGTDSSNMVQVNSFTGTAVPLGNVGFRTNDDVAIFDNIVISDANGGVIYTENFEQSPLTVKLQGNSDAYVVENGAMKIGSADETLVILNDRAVSELTSYTVDFDFLVENKDMGICFGVEGVRDLTMWQFNLEQTNARFRPHFRKNGSWYTKIGMYLVDEQKPSSVWLNKLAHMRIAIDGSKFTAWVGASADSMKVLFEDQDFSASGMSSVPLKNIGFRVCNGEICSYDNIVVRDAAGNVVYSEDFSSQPALNLLGASTPNTAVVDEATGMLRLTSVNNAESFWILYNESATNKSLPAYRKSFTPEKEVASAKLYTSGLGVYESYINGQRVGRRMDDGSVFYEELKPGFTEAKVRKFYNTYDVTWMLQDGENVLSSVVSSGWWSGFVAGNAGKETGYLAKLILTYTDGTVQVIDTDTSWKTAKAAALQDGTDIFNGERYDARVDQSWMLPGFDDSMWGNAKINTEFTGEIVAWDGVPVIIREDLEQKPQSMTVYQGADGATDDAYGTIHVLRTYADGEAVTLNPGETLLVDFGQNFSGWEAFDVQAEAGTTIEVRHAEVLNVGNGAINLGNEGPEGSAYYANLRTATANTIYIAAGEEDEHYHPSQTYYGFQYAEFTADKPVILSGITGQVVTSVLEDTGSLETSDADVNKLISNTRWSMYGNYLSVPTDCPQRDERQGWTADTQNFIEAGSYLSNTKSFLEKWMVDMRDAQRSDGAYPSIAPKGRYGASGYGRVGWADAGIVVPYFLYIMYGDTTVISDNWASMEMFMDYRANNGIDRANNGKGDKLGYGDWLSYESNDEEIKAMLDVSYYAWDALLMSYMAEAIGLTDKAEAYQQVYEEQKAYYQSLYVREDGTLIRNEQSVNLYALFLDLLPDAEATQAVTDALITNIERNGNKLQTGFLGTEIIAHTLTQIGHSDVAYKLLLQHGDPSWLFAVDQGATTIWERWNAYTPEKGYNTAGLASFNHYSYGSILSWMFRSMAGIGWDAENPGFKHILLSPQPSQMMPSVEASFESPYGAIVSNLHYDGTNWNYAFTVPANTTATIRLPAASAESLTYGSPDGLTYVGYADGIATFEAVAGSYTFTCAEKPKYYVNVDAACDNADGMPDVKLLVNGELAAAGVPALLTVCEGDVITADAKTLNTADYAVVGWTCDGTVISETAELNYTVTGSADLTANIGWIGMDNLAAGKTVIGTQVNTDWATANLTDGHLTYHGSNGWSSERIGTAVTFAEQFVTIDLGDKMTFDRFHLYPRNLAPGNVNFPVAYTIYVSDDNAVWTAVYEENDGEVTNGYTPSVVQLADSVSGRYVRLGVTAVNAPDSAGYVYLQLSELGIYKTIDANAAAAEVEALIAAANTAEAVAEARAAYEALSEEAKTLVTNLAILEAAELYWATVNGEVVLTLTGPAEISAFDESVTYTLSAKGMHNLATVILTFDIPETYLAEPVAEPCGDWYIVGQILENSKLYVAMSCNAGVTGDGALLTITLKPVNKPGEASIVLIDADLSSYLGEGETFVSADLTEASVTTQVKHNIFDVNKDGIVDQLDMTRAQRYYGTDNADADVNGSGTVDIDDLILILNNYHEDFMEE